MARGRSWGPRAVSTLLDLAVVGSIALVTYAVWLRPEVGLGPARVLVGGAFVLLLPGYALTAALFPRRQSELSGVGGRLSPGHLSGLERLVYSVGLSIVTVPLLALFLNFTQWGINSQSVVLTLLWFVLVTTGVAAVRRLRVPPAERFRLPVGSTLGGVTSAGPATALIGVLFVLTLAVAGTALVSADGGQRFTEFYILSEDDETGELVADDYPETVATNRGAPIYVGIENNEGRSTNYTVLVEFHRVSSVDGERTIDARWRQKRYEKQLAAGGANATGVRVSPPDSAAGERLRLTLLLYEGPTPENPRIDDAYRSVHIWVDVVAGGGGL
ncbi:DUF1616 domain-containing protein [Haloarcula onubensis]|uniref:DUF1616 domain-containing protein n=1 Tax=Haloarcula onubensis TaxID=2950539 RepID=A0ABU2FN29_9EURY|nr:DUF1616 domain-containing protein [Halomicroarcula sp. S3CR25-11]MDS0281586.1 DUF1616 domain-containing protein [Halomicroarcula sp. S3CR25-11]